MINNKFLSSEDAVSEVVDFVTILGLLVLSIGLIGVAGYPISEKCPGSKPYRKYKTEFYCACK